MAVAAALAVVVVVVLPLAFDVLLLEDVVIAFVVQLLLFMFFHATVAFETAAFALAVAIFII